MRRDSTRRFFLTVEEFSESAWKEELSYIIKDMPDLSYAKQYIKSRIS